MNDFYIICKDSMFNGEKTFRIHAETLDEARDKFISMLSDADRLRYAHHIVIRCAECKEYRKCGV